MGMLIIAGHIEVGPDERDEAVAVMRGQVTRACDAPGRLDVAITADSVDLTGAVPTGRRTAEQADHWNGDHHGVPIFVPSRRLFGVLTSRSELEVVRVIDTPEATQMRYRIRR